MSLPAKPNLENLKKQAKGLLRAHREQDRAAAERIKAQLPRAADADLDAILAGEFSLQEAQLVIARELGFASWPKLVEEVERRNRAGEQKRPNMFTDSVKQIMQHAREESSRLGQNYIGTEHRQ